jgi:ParG protein
MTKKITVRQPTPQPSTSTDDWVRGETATSPPTRRHNPAGKLARLTIDLPVELHGRFKAACANHRTAMKDEVLRFIEEWTQKHGNK